MQATLQITTIGEIEKVMLRFMRVTDDAKLCLIMAKFLPDLIKVYFEKDLNNADIANPTNPKLIQQNELMTHLKNRVENSRGSVTVPTPTLVAIFKSPEYAQCENQQLKRSTTELIFQFLSFSLQFASDKIDAVHFTGEILQCMSSDLPILEKIRLFTMMAWFYIQSGAEPKSLEEAFSLKADNKAVFLQMVALYTLALVSCPYSYWKTNLKPLFQGCVMGYHRSDSKLTQVQHSQKFDEFLLVTCAQSQQLFTTREVIGLMVLATLDQQSCSAGVRYSCDSWIRNQNLELDDAELERVLYSIIYGKFDGLYSNCILKFDEMGMVDRPSDMALKYFIGWVMKLETKTEAPKKIELVSLCLFQREEPGMHKQGLLFARQIIREDPNLTEDGATVLNNALSLVLSQSTFDEDAQALALLLVAELGAKYFKLVLGHSIDLALQTFEKLKERIKEITGVKPIREDDLCLTYMEALNKLRDCYEQNLTDQLSKDALMAKIVSFLTSADASQKQNSELLYILYLYVARLNKDQLSAPLLLHSVNLKDHVDIKIRKEAMTQLERFEKTTKEKTKNLLGPFLEEIRLLFLSLDNPMLSLFVNNDCTPKSGLSYNSNMSHFIDQALIDKIMELSSYALKFFLQDKSNHLQVERLLMLNLNQNFTQVKSDFIKPLKMIKSYLKQTQGKGAGLIVSAEGAFFVNKVGTNSTNLDQKILALKLLFIIFKREKGLYQSADFPSQDGNPKSHEQKMLQLYYLSQKVYFSDGQDKDKFVSLLKEVTTGPVSPNQLEEQKLLANCLAQMNYTDEYSQAVDVMLANVANRQLEVNYKCKVVACLPRILVNSESATLETSVCKQLDLMLDYDQTLVQSAIGKCFAQIWHNTGKILDKTHDTMQQALKVGLQLNSKRNLVTYLYEVVNRYAENSSEMREKYFVEIQQIFMRYLFDRRGFMQDLASKGLSLVYKLGNEEQRALLVTSLSETFSGNAPTKKKEQDEEQELLLDFSNSTNSEQREKLKTYKDLVRVAEELGQRDLIYQFLEVHRHNQAHQDIKNAAKGISSLLMLDDKIRVSLIKIAPKILLLTYDPNQEVQDTMRQLWSSLIPANEEPKFIIDRWDEIFNSCVTSIKAEAWRARQAACLCLSDLIQSSSRQWQDISKEYRILFLTSLGLLSDDHKDSVKQSAYKLVKALRSFTLKFANMYSNTDLKQLQEVLDVTIPIVLDDCLKSMIQKVRQFGLHILAEIIKSTQSQNLAEKLKINNKYERQLVFSGNSLANMSKLLCQKSYLERIITEMILNVSSFQDKGNQQLNYAQQLQADGKLKINKQELADLAMRYSRESINGEILKICRSLMTQETFDAVLTTLLQIIQKGNYDMLTKQTACGFIQDLGFENIEMISAQNAKKIAQKVIQVYTQQTASASLGMKDALVSAYASCFGLQFKILRAFPNTVKAILTSVKELEKDLLYIKSLHFLQIIKYLPITMLEDPETCKDFLPLVYINKFNMQDMKLKKLSEKIWDQYHDSMGGDQKLSELMSCEILKQLVISFDSSAYADRISASQAFAQIVKYSKDEDLVKQTSSKLLSIITGKYFSGKEQILQAFTTMMTDDLVEISKEDYLQGILPQIQNLNLEPSYRNQLLKSLKPSLPKVLQTTNLFDCLVQQLEIALQTIVEQSQASLLLESQGQFFDFNERKESEQAVLTQVICIFDLMPQLVGESTRSKMDVLACAFYGKTHWMVRRSILQCYAKLQDCQVFGSYLIRQVADCGEKYELNLSMVSDLTYRTLSKFSAQERPKELKVAALKIVELLSQRSSEELRRNMDVIRQLSN